MHESVDDWSGDYDIFDPKYIENPYPIWQELRVSCPVPHTQRWGGSHMTTTNEDTRKIAKMVDVFSSINPLVVSSDVPVTFDTDTYGVGAPPISTDPPQHGPARRLILPALSPQAVIGYRPFTEQICRSLVTEMGDATYADAAEQYAQQIPPRVIAHILGVDLDDADQFVAWVRDVLEQGKGDVNKRLDAGLAIRMYFAEQVKLKRQSPGSDMVSQILSGDLDGTPVTDPHAIATCVLLLIAGIDTTWSSIGSAIWHLATHPDDQAQLRQNRDLLPVAIEEFLRAYSPVTMARLVLKPIRYNGVDFAPGDKLLLNFPAANRDPLAFEDPESVQIDRRDNRHIAFGIGIHRCAGSNLARMEMETSLRILLEMMPPFTLDPRRSVTWGGGQVRGPRNLPLRFSD